MKSAKSTRTCSLVVVVMLALGVAAAAAPQQNSNSSTPAASFTTVPRLVTFSGVVKEPSGTPVTGAVNLSFSLYALQEGGSPLWTETQKVQLDDQGHYTVLLGATEPEGLPLELFTSGQAQWLGVQPQLLGVGELPRVLLVGMPYALKAADADTLGGKPASAYLTVGSQPASEGTAPGALASTAGAASNQLLTSPAGSQVQSPSAPGGSGTADYIPIWTNSTTLGNSTLFETSGKVGIGNTSPAGTLDVSGKAFVRGTLQLPATGTATATEGFNSYPHDWIASVFNGTSQVPANQLFPWQAEPVGNNTSSPSGKFNLLFATGTATPAETGVSISSTGNLTGKQLVSTVATGTAPLAVSSTTQVAKPNASLQGGLASSAFAQVGGANTFNGDQSVKGNVSSTKQLVSTVATGTAPLEVSSTTQVANLNASLLGADSCVKGT